MSKRAEWEREKLKARMQAKSVKPEKPRYGEEASINTSIFNAKNSMPKAGEADQELFSNLQKNWDAGPNRDSGDALLDGFKSGMKSGSITEDKKRMDQYVAGMEKLKGMVSDTNERLYKEEKLDGARRSLEPRVFAYKEQANSMTPNDRLSYLRNAFKEYNQLAGTNYEPIATDAGEPWKVTFADGDEIQRLNLLTFIKSTQEQELDVYLKSNEANNIERMAINQDNAESQLRNAKMSKYTKEAELAQNTMNKKQEMIQSKQMPEGSLMFDEITDKAEKKFRLQELKDDMEKLKPTEAAIEALDKMDDIFTKYPGISTSMAKWAQSKDDTLIGNFLKNIVNKDERDAVLELEKHAATLTVGTIQQFKGQRPTDVLKKLFKDTNPNSSFTKGAFLPIKNQYMAPLMKQKDKSLESENAWKNRYFSSYANIGKKPAAPITPQEIQAQDPSITEADIAEAQRRLNGGK